MTTHSTLVRFLVAADSISECRQALRSDARTEVKAVRSFGAPLDPGQRCVTFAGVWSRRKNPVCRSLVQHWTLVALGMPRPADL